VKLAQKSFWLHLMELLGDVGQEEAHFRLVGDCVNLGRKIRAWFAIGCEIILDAPDGTPT
jgi:hypothetical protein